MKGDVGKIRFADRASQQVDYTGLRYHGNATPSNVDGLLELDDRLYVVLEYKHVSASKMSRGQELLLERLTDSLWQPGKVSIAIVGEHNQPSHAEIDGANSRAVRIRWKGEWRDMRNANITVKQCVDRAYEHAFCDPF